MSKQNKNIEAIYELSPMQQGMLFHTIYNEDSNNYFEQLSVNLEGELDISIFKSAWIKIIERHSILRTSFVYKKIDKMLQVVHRKIELPFIIEDWSNKNSEMQKEDLKELLVKDKQNKFNLSKAPLLRITLVKLSVEEYFLIWSHHHILIDGWSLPIILKELFTIYENLKNSKNIDFTPVKPYQEYIRFLQKKNSVEAHNFWKTYLKDFTSKTHLMIDYKPKSDDETIYRKETISIDEETSTRLNNIAQNNKLTLNTLLQGIWAILLHKYSSDNDIIFGATFSGRPATLKDSETMVGLFINSLPIRAKINPKMSFIEWLVQFNKQNAELKEYEWSPLVDIQKASEIPSKQNLFDSLFVFENYPVSSVAKNNNTSLKIKDLHSFEQTNYPLTLVSAPGKVINFDAAYNENIIDRESIIALLDHLINITMLIVKNPNVLISNIDLLSKQNKLELLPLKYISKDFAEPFIVIKQFENIVKKYPQNIAIKDGDKKLSYSELNCKANKIAKYLIERGISNEDLVAIYINRKIDMIVSIIAILKTGAGYVPIDTSYPKVRVEHVLTDSETKLLISESKLIENINYNKNQIIYLEKINDLISNYEDSDINNRIFPENISYVIYTSGSTGRPKGTLIQNRSFYNFVKDFSTSLCINKDSKILQFASIGFDASIPEIFSPLLNGGLVHLISKEIINDHKRFSEFIIENKITNLLLPPSVLSALPFIDSPYLKSILSAGEMCTWDIVDKWSTKYRFINAYGPTEATVGCTWGNYENRLNTKSVPIGKPSYNIKVYILDKNMKPVPYGIPGELFIGEKALSRGYLNKPDLTAEKFIPNPYSKEPGERIYSTRDLVRLLSNGDIEFIGRIDKQVKLRGFRVELGEIETVLTKIESIKQAVVILKAEDKKLISFIIPKIEAEININEIKNRIKNELPTFMIPTHYEIINEFPLTTHGKIDRKKLENIKISISTSLDDSNDLISATEELLLTIVKSVTKNNNVNSLSNFFDIGGHSLLATQLVSRVRNTFNIDLPISSVFENETIKDLSQEIDKLINEDSKLENISIIKYDRSENLNLSFAQQRMWFLQKFDETNISSNIYSYFILKGEFNISIFGQAIDQIIEKHEILRTYYSEIEGKPIQIIEPNISFNIPVTDISQINIEEQSRIVNKSIVDESQYVFDLTVLPLFRISILKKNNNEHVLLITMHHIISDGWSMSIMIKEFVNNYKNIISNNNSLNNELTIQYADYAQWQRETLNESNLKKYLDYWSKELIDIPEKIDLPIDKPRPTVQTFNGKELNFEISKEVSNTILEVCKKISITPFMLTLTAFKIMLHKLSNQSTIVVGSPIANRNLKEIENLIGMFVNTLVYKTDFSSNDTILDVLNKTREKTIQNYLHQNLPFEKLVDAIQPNRELSYSPLFQVAFVFQNLPTEKIELPNLSIVPINNSNEISKYDVSLYLKNTKKGFSGTFEYNTDLFNDSTIYNFKEYFLKVLELVVNNNKLKISKLSFLSHDELNLILHEWNSRKKEKNIDSNIVESFNNIVKSNKASIATTYSEFDGNTLLTDEITYEVLNEKSNQLARYLIKQGVKKEELIGVSLYRSIDLIISIIAVLKTGCAFLPIDPNYPDERIKFMIEDSEVENIITQSSIDFPKINNDINLIKLDEKSDSLNEENEKDLNTKIDSDNLAYCIYTSGTTGNPKGTLLEHQGVVNLSEEQKDNFNITNSSKVLQFSSLSFDAFVWEFVMALLNGASLNLVNKEIISSGKDLVNALKGLEISHVTLPPSVLSIIPDSSIVTKELRKLKTIIVAGEECSSELAKTWSYKRQFVNAYGPTETTVCASMFNVPEYNKVKPSIGTSLRNFKLYILDSHLNVVPIGVAGELYISGISLSRGYHNLPDLTAQKFIPNPYSNIVGDRIYKSGDLVKYLPTGEIEFIGRIDNQIKLRGFRIELSEINSTLLKYNSITNAITILREDTPNQKQIVSYLVVSKNSELEISNIKEFLRNKLPEYMIPTAFVILEVLPFTPSNKIDYKSLPKPNLNNIINKDNFVAPRNEIENEIANIGKDLLGIDSMGVYDNFFELGGHSLLVTQFIAKIKTKLNKEITVRELFENPTIAEISMILGKVSEISDSDVMVIEKQDRGTSDILKLVNELDNLTDEEVKLLLENGKE